MIYTTIIIRDTFCYICFNTLYFNILSLAIIGRFHRKPELPVNAHFEAFVLDL